VAGVPPAIFKCCSRHGCRYSYLSSSFTAAKALTANSKSSRKCAADTCVRMRAVPCGTLFTQVIYWGRCILYLKLLGHQLAFALFKFERAIAHHNSVDSDHRVGCTNRRNCGAPPACYPTEAAHPNLRRQCSESTSDRRNHWRDRHLSRRQNGSCSQLDDVATAVRGLVARAHACVYPHYRRSFCAAPKIKSPSFTNRDVAAAGDNRRKGHVSSCVCLLASSKSFFFAASPFSQLAALPAR
jgi:hypothetical protein